MFASQTTNMNLGRVHCLASQAPTLDVCLEVPKSRRFGMPGLI